MSTIHMPAVFHTVCTKEYTHCAFTQKVLRFPKMVQPFGHNVIEYGVEGSESEASEHVDLLTRDAHQKLLTPLGANEHMGSQAKIGSEVWKAFDSKLRMELQRRVKRYDIIAHPFGRSHMDLVRLFPEQFHVETGIGYPDEPFGAFRIWESEAWRHWHWGHWEGKCQKNDNRLFSWVIPNYFDVEDWPAKINPSPDPYVLFMGRFIPLKGVHTIRQIAEAWYSGQGPNGTSVKRPSLRFVFAGVGDWEEYLKQVPESLHFAFEYRGPVIGKDRADLVGDALCMLMPTNFIEPFGGSGVEAMLTGTPLIASDFGAFTETVIHGKTGYRCKTLGDWVQAIDNVHAGKISRAYTAMTARKRYSLETCGPMYDQAFQQITSLYGPGWNGYEPRNLALDLYR